MQDLKKILESRNLVINNNTRINNKFERAKQFLEYIGLDANRGNIIFVLKLCKKYGAGETYSLKSWIKDMRFDPTRWKGLLVWKLQKTQVIQTKIPLDNL